MLIKLTTEGLTGKTLSEINQVINSTFRAERKLIKCWDFISAGNFAMAKRRDSVQQQLVNSSNMYLGTYLQTSM